VKECEALAFQDMKENGEVRHEYYLGYLSGFIAARDRAALVSFDQTGFTYQFFKILMLGEGLAK
jgi:hypothetical protein